MIVMPLNRRNQVYTDFFTIMGGIRFRGIRKCDD